MNNKPQKHYKAWLTTFTKKAVAVILIVSLIDLQLSYILAFMGKEQIAESLSSTIANTIIGVMLGYFLKALFETFFEEREKRLNKKLEQNCSFEEDEIVDLYCTLVINKRRRFDQIPDNFKTKVEARLRELGL